MTPAAPSNLAHPDRKQLVAFLHGRLPAGVHTEVERHVAACSACCEVLSKLPEDTWLENLRVGSTGLGVSGADAGAAQLRQAATSIPPELADHPRYKVIRPIGAGGMGEVYLAEHRVMERSVVLKVIHRELVKNPVAAHRFRVEVKAAAQLDHPNIVRAYDADQAGELHFLAMEYVEGRSLDKLVATHRPLAHAAACHYIRQAALGLQHAFQKGMVHRDIKPQNLMLTPRGQVKILDFGLAQFAQGASGHEAVAVAASHRPGTIVTAAGAVFGTPDYISPEQARSAREVDIRSDIYSLGCTLYHLLAGQPPFPEGTPHEKLAAHAQRTASSLLEISPAVPAKLVAIVERMMAKDPTQRFQSPAEVAQSLAEFVKPQPATTPPTPPPLPTPASLRVAPSLALRTAALAAKVQPLIRRRPMATTALIAGLLLAAASTWYFVWNHGAANENMAAPSVGIAGQRPGGRAVVLFIVPSQFFYDDYRLVRDGLEASQQVIVKTASTGPCEPLNDDRTGGGFRPDITIRDQPLSSADYDALYFPGGFIHLYKEDTPQRGVVWKLIDEMLAAGKPVAALGQGQGVMAFKGTLEDRTVAGSRFLQHNMPLAARSWSDEPVEVDGPIITASESANAQDLAAALLRELGPK